MICEGPHSAKEGERHTQRAVPRSGINWLFCRDTVCHGQRLRLPIAFYTGLPCHLQVEAQSTPGAIYTPCLHASANPHFGCFSKGSPASFADCLAEIWRLSAAPISRSSAVKRSTERSLSWSLTSTAALSPVAPPPATHSNRFLGSSHPQDLDTAVHRLIDEQGCSFRAESLLADLIP